MYKCLSVQDTDVRGADVASISQVLPSAILSLLIVRNWELWLWVLAVWYNIRIEFCVK